MTEWREISILLVSIQCRNKYPQKKYLSVMLADNESIFGTNMERYETLVYRQHNRTLLQSSLWS